MDTNLWMSQGSETLGCFIWKIIKTAKIAKIAELLILILEDRLRIIIL